MIDDFKGDNEHLIACIEALLRLDGAKALVPHGIGGHARGLLSAAGVRLAAKDAEIAELRRAFDRAEADVQILVRDLDRVHSMLRKATHERDSARENIKALQTAVELASSVAVQNGRESDEARGCVRKLCKFVQFLYDTYPDPIRGGCESVLEATPPHLR